MTRKGCWFRMAGALARIVASLGWIGWTAWISLPGAGCGREEHREASADTPERAAPAERGDQASIRYEAGKVPVDFMKIVTAVESDGAGALSLPGRVTYNEDRTQHLSSPIDGRAARILVKLGDRVRAGQPLIELSSPSVGQMQADAQKAASELALSGKSIERVRRLQEDGAIAAKEVAQAEADHRKAIAEMERAKAQLAALGISATDPTVTVSLRAQIGGTVVERNVLLGQEVRADQATPLLTISDVDALWVLGDVYEQDLSLVNVGDAVSIRVPAYPAEVFAGTIGHVSGVLDPTTHTVKVRCVIPNLDHRLEPEMFAQIDVRSGATRKSVYLPSNAVLNEGDKSMVIVATGPTSFRFRPVSVGPDVDGRIRILKGVAPGERVVSDGAIFMKREVESQE